MLFTLSNLNGLFGVASGKENMDLKLVISIKSETNSASNMVYMACGNCSDGNGRGKMEIDHGLAPWFVIGHATTHSWGLRPHPGLVAWPITAPGAEPWSFPTKGSPWNGMKWDLSSLVLLAISWVHKSTSFLFNYCVLTFAIISFVILTKNIHSLRCNSQVYDANKI